MHNFQTIEADICQKLNEYFISEDAQVDTGVSAMVLPEVEAEVKTPMENGQVVVCYKKSTFDPPVATDHVAQPEVIHLELQIQARKLRGTLGIYNIIDLTKRVLMGYRPTGCGKITMVDSSLVDFKENLWTYCLTISTTGVAVEMKAVPVEPLVRQIILDGGNYLHVEVNTTLPEPETEPEPES